MSIAYQPLDLWGTLGTLRDPERHRDRPRLGSMPCSSPKFGRVGKFLSVNASVILFDNS